MGGWEGGWGEALLLAARHRSACARERCTFLFLRKQVFDKKNHTALKVAFLSNMLLTVYIFIWSDGFLLMFAVCAFFCLFACVLCVCCMLVCVNNYLCICVCLCLCVCVCVCMCVCMCVCVCVYVCMCDTFWRKESQPDDAVLWDIIVHSCVHLSVASKTRLNKGSFETSKYFSTKLLKSTSNNTKKY